MFSSLIQSYSSYKKKHSHRHLWSFLHLDLPLLFGLLLLMTVGLVILYSASNENKMIVHQQFLHCGVSLAIMFLVAQIPPTVYQRWAPTLYAVGIVCLIAVLMIGHIGKGAQRWLSLGVFRIQPSEIMKLAIPLLLAWFYQKVHLPLTWRSIYISFFIIFIPALLTAKQPDLSTAIILIISGMSALVLSGLSFWFIGIATGLIAFFAPVFWYCLHSYQRLRILTFFNPERDALGAGYHIIQSKIAIGSGGLFGKGWLNGTQSHLHFLPEHATDFIFAACGEEFGFMGNIILIILFMLIVARGLYITIHAQDTFSRVLAGSLSLTFFVSFFINMGMVSGILPVMGIPLPLISYGGSSMLTLMMQFGILMSIQTHRKLLSS